MPRDERGSRPYGLEDFDQRRLTRAMHDYHSCPGEQTANKAADALGINAEEFLDLAAKWLDAAAARLRFAPTPAAADGLTDDQRTLVTRAIESMPEGDVSQVSAEAMRLFREASIQIGWLKLTMALKRMMSSRTC